jgi:hypothetical protein
MREPYICLYCDQRSTRWWNLKIHMKRKHGEYSPGRSSGQYTPNNPYHNIGGTVADSVGNTFQPQPPPPRIAQYSTGPMYRPIDDQGYGTGLSPQTNLKIEELKMLVHKYPQYHTNPHGIITWAIHSSINGDNKFLDEKLEQLRSIDRRY